MQATDFPESNRALTAPKGMEETVYTLHVYNDGQHSVSCWQPSEAEREAIAAGGPIWLGVGAGASAPPVWVCGLKPYMPAVVYEPSESMLHALEFIAKLLPDSSTVDQGLQDGAELAKLWPELRDPKGEPLDASKQYYVAGVATQAEHYAALVETYRQGGQPAVVAYLQPYAAFLPKEVLTGPQVSTVTGAGE